MRLNLTDEQRLILANQHKILSHLDTDNATYHAQRAEHLMQGLEHFYREAQDLYEVMPIEDEQLVKSILWLYDSMVNSYRELDDKTGISEETLEWPGFDGNHEIEHLIFARALQAAGEYTAVLGEHRPLNSHCTMIDSYQRMLAAWSRMGQPTLMTRQQIIDVLAARR